MHVNFVGRHQRHLVIAIAGALVATSAVAMPPEPIIGPPIATGETGVAVADPLVPVPPETPCVVKLFSADTPTGTFDDYANHSFTYAPPAGCKGPWNKVVFKADYHVTAGNQFDRTASVGIGGVNIYFGSTQEPSSARAPSWHVERDVTDLTALLEQPHPGAAALYNIYNSTYNGSITGSAELDFYPAVPRYPAPREPDQVLSLTPDLAGPGHADVNTAGTPLTRTFTLPTNVDRAYIDVTAEPQSGDEFWYSCGPDAYISITGCGGTAFRVAEVSIDGKPAGIVPISGWVFTGGIDPFLWRPTPGVQTLNFQPYRIDITPFAGLLDNGKPHTISVSIANGDAAFQNNGQYFDTAATLLLYRDPHATQLLGALAEDRDSGVHPVQKNVANPDGIHYAFNVGARQRLVTRGYLLTPRGRIESKVVQETHFDNAQQVTTSATQSIQDITQTSNAVERSSRGRFGQMRTQTTYWSFPLDMDIAVQVAADGSQTQTTKVHQHYTLRTRGDGWPMYASDRNQDDAATDTLNFNAAGSFTGATARQSTQSYRFTDSRGTCFDRSVSAVAGAVTQVIDGKGCRSRHGWQSRQ